MRLGLLTASRKEPSPVSFRLVTWYTDPLLPPTIRGKFHRNLGIRARVNTTSLDVTLQQNANMLPMEDKIIEEGALELAYEGNRWQDLMRIANRRGDAAFLADKVYNKLLKDGNPAAGTVRAKLMDKANWFLPFK